MSQIIKFEIDGTDYYISESNAKIAAALDEKERTTYVRRACLSVGEVPKGVPLSRVSQGPTSTAEPPAAVPKLEVKKDN